MCYTNLYTLKSGDWNGTALSPVTWNKQHILKKKREKDECEKTKAVIFEIFHVN